MPNFLQLNMDAPKMQVMPQAEYKLKIVKVEPHSKEKDGKTSNSLRVQFTLPDHPEAFDVTNYIGTPNAGDDQAAINKKINRLRTFFSCFDIPYSDEPGFNLNLDSMVGKTGWANLKMSSDPGYDEKNDVQRFLPARK